MLEKDYVSTINIPAYDAFKNGIVVEFKLTIYPNNPFIINSIGNIAMALQNNFKRTIEIMSSIKKSWECLESAGYMLECSHNQFIVKDSKSSSMALSIALINGFRAINNMPQRSGFSGTGILRIDGSFESGHLEDKKYLAAKKEVKALNKFITPHECKHLFDLEKLIYDYH
jgi:hypothetical protein